jgi:hypothetical protein
VLREDYTSDHEKLRDSLAGFALRHDQHLPHEEGWIERRVLTHTLCHLCPVPLPLHDATCFTHLASGFLSALFLGI